MVDIVDAATASEYLAGKGLIEEYARGLGVDLRFQHLDDELENLRTVYGPPGGCLLLARADQAFVGLVALRAHTDTIGELKRLYIRQPHRGIGGGRALAKAALIRARELGYATVVLDTLQTMDEARSLYASLGFAATDAYYLNPLAGTRYMKLDLGTP